MTEHGTRHSKQKKMIAILISSGDFDCGGGHDRWKNSDAGRIKTLHAQHQELVFFLHHEPETVAKAD